MNRDGEEDISLIGEDISLAGRAKSTIEAAEKR